MKRAKYNGIFESLNRQYVDIINELYLESYNANPAAYPFYSIDNCDCTIIVNDTDYFYDIDSFLYITLKKDEVGNISINDLSSIMTKSDIQLMSGDLILRNEVYKKMKLGIIVIIYNLDENFINFILKNNGGMKSICVRDILEYRQSYLRLMNSSNSELSKKEFNNRYQFSKYNVQDAIRFFEFKNNDNSEQLETLFEQAMFCYESNKYLASAACIGVAIEELCLLILEDCGLDEGLRNKNTTIVELAGILRTKGIVNRRINSVLVASSIIRNSVSHTSSGFVSAMQTDNLIASFKSLFEAYLNFISKKKNN